MDFPRHEQQTNLVGYETVKARSDRLMKWFMPLLLAMVLTPLAAAQHAAVDLVAHGERKKAAYLVLRLITQEMEVIPTESLYQCQVIGEAMMKGGKLSKFLKGYKCIPGLL